MSDDEVLKYLGRAPRQVKKPLRVMKAPGPKTPAEKTFDEFSATHLFCPTCRRATEVRENVLLYLSDGDLYGYFCKVCGTSVGTRKVGR